MKKSLAPLLIVAASLLAACATSKPARKAPGAEAAQAEKTGPAEAAPAPPATEVTEASLREGAFSLRPDLKTIPFDYDSANLSEDARTALKANAAILKADPSVDVLVAGHCDERGTVAYNLALGQRRAKEVRDYYILLGVDGTRIATISYGKEQPLCSESTDACWSKNRRAETRAHSAK